jgi:hypothetical protein
LSSGFSFLSVYSGRSAGPGTLAICPSVHHSSLSIMRESLPSSALESSFSGSTRTIKSTASHRTGSISIHLCFSFVIIPLHITSPKFSRRKIVLGGGKERGSHLFYYTTSFLRYHGHLGSAPSIHIYIPAYVYFYLRCKTCCFFEACLSTSRLLLNCYITSERTIAFRL